MYSAAVLDHFKNPRNAGELPDATASVEVSNPVCGDVLQLSARLSDGKITAIRFRASGCVTSLACASVLTELVSGRLLTEASQMKETEISDSLGGLPPATFHGAQLACDALHALIDRIK
jgi:nitrogen fixation NifU-like protein